MCGWKHSVWLAWPLLLHLPHRWRRMRACSHQTPPENLPSHRFPWRFSELILCQLVQLHVSSWKQGAWLARTCLLHGFLARRLTVRSAVGLRGSGAEIPDACVSTAADDQLLQVSSAPTATKRGSEPTSCQRLCWSRRRGMPQLHCQHRQQRQVGTRPCETTNTASIVASVVATNDAYGAICTRCARAVCRCMGSFVGRRRFSCLVNCCRAPSLSFRPQANTSVIGHRPRFCSMHKEHLVVMSDLYFL